MVQLLICPAISCEAEHSSSALRCLKTWLRNRTTQARLNVIAVNHIQQDLLDPVDIDPVAEVLENKSATHAKI